MNLVDVYTAGLMDGEGTVTLLRDRKKNPFKRPVVSVSSTSEELIDFLQSTYGGRRQYVKPKKKEHRDAWHWVLANDAALELLKRIAPNLRENKKKARAIHLIERYKAVTPRNGKYTDEMKRAKLDFEKSFFAL